MEIAIQRHGEDVILVRLTGRLDAGSAAEVEKQLGELVDAGNFKLVLNFHNVTYLSSAGMRLLLALTKRLNHLDGSLIICSLSKEVSDVVHMAGFHQILILYPSEEESIAHIEVK